MVGQLSEPTLLTEQAQLRQWLGKIAVYHSFEPVPYAQAVSLMDQHVAAIISDNAPEAIWLLEHPPIITMGTSAKTSDLLAPCATIPVVKSSRGGQITYHGPGQRVVYVMLRLSRFGNDVRAYVHCLEEVVILALAQVGVRAERRDGAIGVWIARAPQPQKIAALGVRVRKHVSLHGVCVNICPDLSAYDHFVPCGLSSKDYGVTSLARCVATMPTPPRHSISRHSISRHSISRLSSANLSVASLDAALIAGLSAALPRQPNGNGAIAQSATR